MRMSKRETERLLDSFPETPAWVVERLSYEEAVDVMELRRSAFPLTTPERREHENGSARR
jgi:DNA-binding GntR family transcriptional regulator